MSTSRSEGIAKNFSGKIVMHIQVPEGHPVIHIGDHSHSVGESEILLPRGSSIKVLKTESIQSSYGTPTIHVYARMAA